MAEPLRPHVAIASARILDVAALAGGGYAVLTDAGIELFDASLARRATIATIAGERAGAVLVAVPGDRFLVHGTMRSWLYEGAAGGALAKVDVPEDLGEGMVASVAVTETGFLVITTKHVLVDHAGARTYMTPSGCLDFGGTPWRGGAAIAGYEGLAILGADGTIVARSAGAQPWKRPVALADAIAVPAYDDVMVPARRRRRSRRARVLRHRRVDPRRRGRRARPADHREARA